jgi:hypothetical protein
MDGLVASGLGTRRRSSMVGRLAHVRAEQLTRIAIVHRQRSPRTEQAGKGG